MTVAQAVTGTRPTPRRIVDRLVALALLAMMAVGCLALWVAVPAGILIGLGKLTESPTAHLALGLVLVPVGMISTGVLLAWMNHLYLRVTGVVGRFKPSEDDAPRRLRGPLEPLLLASFFLALVALAVLIVVNPDNAQPLAPF